MEVLITACGLTTPRFSCWGDLRAPLVSGPVPENWFDADAHLGKKGHKYVSLASKYAIAASLIAHDNKVSGAHTAVVLGSNLADYWVRRDFDRVILAEGADALSPADAPNISVNLPASYIAMRHGFTGANLTLTNYVTAGAEALHYSSRLLASSRADRVYCGAVEEYHSEWIAGGACLLRVERGGVRNKPAMAKLRGSELAFVPEPASSRGVARIKALVDQFDSPRTLPVWLVGPCDRTLSELALAFSKCWRGPVINLAHQNVAFAASHSLLPLLQSLWLLANGKEGVVIVVSPSGPLLILNLFLGEKPCHN